MTENQHIIDTLMIFYNKLNMINYRPNTKDYSYNFSDDDIVETCKELEQYRFLINEYKKSESGTKYLMNGKITKLGIDYLKRIGEIG